MPETAADLLRRKVEVPSNLRSAEWSAYVFRAASGLA